MARYKDVHYDQDKFIPVSFRKQILPGTFEYTLSYLIDKELDLSVFESRYQNDETGAPAFDPAVLLKIVLYAYSRGITSSRGIEQACRENIIFMALSADTQPHFTTIASFISTMDEQIVPLFRNVLLICDELKLIGGDMFAIDGYLPDLSFRKRDPRFAGVERYRARDKKDKQTYYGKKPSHYTSPDFRYDEATHTCICPAGKKLYSNGRANNTGGYEALKFRGAKRDCVPCTHRDRCFRDPDKTETRQVAIFVGRSKQTGTNYLDLMKQKIDTSEGRYQYSRRMGVVEPVFANICSAVGLNRFSLRGKKKVDIQWKLYCMVHNLLKIHRYGELDCT